MSVEVRTEETFLLAVRRIAAEVAADHAAEVDHEGRFPHETLAALREAEALSAAVPTELGGGGVSLAALAEACCELGRHCAASAMVFAMHGIQVLTLARHLDGAQWFEGYLGELAREQRLVASVTSEVGTGGDMGRSIAAVQAAPDGGGLTLTKQAPTVSYGAHCDDLLITARRGPEAEASDQVVVLCRGEDTERILTGTWDTIGMRGTCSPGFTVRADFAPEQVLAAPFATVMTESMVPVSHILWAHLWLGIATDAFERGRAFVRASARRAPGAPVRRPTAAPVPAAHSLSRVMSELAMLRAEVRSGLVDFERWSEEAGRERLSTMGAVLRFNNLKLAASEQTPRICQAVLETVGIAAYKNDSPYGVGRHLRDALSARLMVANERIHTVDAGLLMIAKEL